MSEQPTGSTSTQRFYSVKMLDRSNSGPPDASCYDLDKGRGQLLDAWGERVLQATLRRS
jgi:hypothetical protein